MAGVVKQIINLGLLHEYLFESLIPALFPVGLFLMLSRKLGWWDRALLIAFLTQPLAYVFYWHRDSFLGPRYLFVGLVFLLPLLVRSLFWLGSQRLEYRLGNAAARHILSALLLVNIVYMLLIGAPTRLTIYHSGLKSFKADIAAEAFDQGIREGLVFVPVSYGARIISNLRELGVPAWLIEQVYRGTDHCDLGARARYFLNEGVPSHQVVKELQQLLAESRAVTKVLVNQDKTFRMYTDRVEAIPGDCLSEIQYDNLGYTLVEPHLLHNDPYLRGPLLIARDLRERNYELAALYPNHPAYLYRKGRFIPLKFHKPHEQH
ncbi:MAG: hypothetical protein QY326_04055 [Bdellovibrionota bacterium]|nr:MAG: hypothetical protein QY326_04055 [Bdellovibrionota bacterium]